MNHSLIHFAGDGLNDICLLENLANTFAVKPKDPKVELAATGVVYELTDILNRWS